MAVLTMIKISPSLNMLKPDMAFALKWLSDEQRQRLEQRVWDMSYKQYLWLKYGGDGDGKDY